MQKKRVGVVGTICLDTIYPYGGEKITGLGGIYYSLAALSHMFGEKADIYPFVHIGEDLFPKLPAIFRKFHNVMRNGFIKVPGQNNRVTDRYFSPSERDEFSTHVPPPLEKREIDFSIPYDVFYVNFISGMEMTIGTFEAIRKELNCPLYVDMHALVMGFRERGERFFRRPPEWKKVIGSGNIIQMNEKEAKLLGGFKEESGENFRAFGLRVLEMGPDIVLITLGAKGSILFYRKRKTPKVIPIEPFTIGRVREVTGCGDVYASGFIMKYIETGDPHQSASFASMAAGIKAGYKGSRNLFRIRNYLRTHDR